MTFFSDCVVVVVIFFVPSSYVSVTFLTSVVIFPAVLWDVSLRLSMILAVFFAVDLGDAWGVPPEVLDGMELSIMPEPAPPDVPELPLETVLLSWLVVLLACPPSFCLFSLRYSS